MDSATLSQLALFAIEAIAICGLLLWFFHLRSHFGYSLLYITLGAFQHLQSLLATTLFIEILPGIVVSPGSTVLFTATLFVVLLVYIREDAAQARTLIVGIVAANLTISLMLKLAALHLNSDIALATSFTNEHLLNWSAGTFVVGTATLILDVVLIIVLYEFFYRVFPRILLLRILAAMLVVVTVDTAIFATAAFHGQENFLQILTSYVIGKSAVAVVYSLMLTAYLLLRRRREKFSSDMQKPIRDIFHILTYKQRYERLEHELNRDSLSGLFNRRFFDENLRRELDRAKRLQHDLNLVLIDIDHFKSINDRFGHQAGDDAIIALADSMQNAFRSADIRCRYGGEEFAVIMPDSSVPAAFAATRRLQEEYSRTCAERQLPVGSDVTFTAGIANFPNDGSTEADLIGFADRRLYKGKNRGRNQVLADTAIMRTIELQ